MASTARSPFRNLVKSFLGFFCLPSLIYSRSKGVLWIVEPSYIPVQCFSWKGVVFLARSYFSGIFRIFKGLFELDLLL